LLPLGRRVFGGIGGGWRYGFGADIIIFIVVIFVV
jgi:hypothetical protein